MGFVTEKDIMEKIHEVIGEKSYIESLPDCVIFLQKNFAQILGRDKKKLLISAILSLPSNKGLSAEEKLKLVDDLNVAIDSLVYIAKSASTLFQKVKKTKRCLIC